MQHVYWDFETFSQVNLKDRGAHIYANDKTTGIFFFCYAVGAGEVQTWYPGHPVPFANPTDFLFVSDNFSFERAIHESILVRRYGFPSIPLEHTDCAERRALAASYPAEMGLRCEALGLPLRKDPEARKAMMRLARPQTKKKQSTKPEDPAQWRTAHPATRKLGRDLVRAIRVAIRIGQNRSILVAGVPQPPLVIAFDGDTLTMTLPSGRAIHYPGAQLVPNSKFEDGEADVEFFDNAKRQWKRVRAWYGTFLENAVQGIARDLLAAALLRAEARGWPTVFHCHDELVIEVPEGTLPDAEVLAMLKEPPVWAIGLPLNGKVHRGPTYLEAPATREPPEPETEQDLVEHAVDAFVATTPPNLDIVRAADEDFLSSLTETVAPLYDFVTLPMTASQHVSCPFHDDPQPSCKIYPDHWHCFGCGRRGGRLDWLCEVEGMTKREAIDALQDWSGPVLGEQRNDTAARIALALQLWQEAGSLAGTLGARYLAEMRGIDITKLSPTIHEVLRFHSSCIFGTRARHPCIVALMRDPVTDAPTGMHRIGLDPTGNKLDRMALGRMGVVKLWSVDGDRLVVGEGIETVLAAATRITYRDAVLTPAWAALNEGGLADLPVLPGITQLTLLVDNDANGVGQKAAGNCKRVWTAAGRTVATLIPKQEGWDFNDVILRQSAA